MSQELSKTLTWPHANIFAPLGRPITEAGAVRRVRSPRPSYNALASNQKQIDKYVTKTMNLKFVVVTPAIDI